MSDNLELDTLLHDCKRTVAEAETSLHGIGNLLSPARGAAAVALKRDRRSVSDGAARVAAKLSPGTNIAERERGIVGMSFNALKSRLTFEPNETLIESKRQYVSKMQNIVHDDYENRKRASLICRSPGNRAKELERKPFDPKIWKRTQELTAMSIMNYVDMREQKHHEKKLRDKMENGDVKSLLQVRAMLRKQARERKSGKPLHRSHSDKAVSLARRFLPDFTPSDYNGLKGAQRRRAMEPDIKVYDDFPYSTPERLQELHERSIENYRAMRDAYTKEWELKRLLNEGDAIQMIEVRSELNRRTHVQLPKDPNFPWASRDRIEMLKKDSISKYMQMRTNYAEQEELKRQLGDGNAKQLIITRRKIRQKVEKSMRERGLADKFPPPPTGLVSERTKNVTRESVELYVDRRKEHVQAVKAETERTLKKNRSNLALSQDTSNRVEHFIVGSEGSDAVETPGNVITLVTNPVEIEEAGSTTNLKVVWTPSETMPTETIMKLSKSVGELSIKDEDQKRTVSSGFKVTAGSKDYSIGSKSGANKDIGAKRSETKLIVTTEWPIYQNIDAGEVMVTFEVNDQPHFSNWHMSEKYMQEFESTKEILEEVLGQTFGLDLSVQLIRKSDTIPSSSSEISSYLSGPSSMEGMLKREVGATIISDCKEGAADEDSVMEEVWQQRYWQLRGPFLMFWKSKEDAQPPGRTVLSPDVMNAGSTAESGSVPAPHAAIDLRNALGVEQDQREMRIKMRGMPSAIRFRATTGNESSLTSWYRSIKVHLEDIEDYRHIKKKHTRSKNKNYKWQEAVRMDKPFSTGWSKLTEQLIYMDRSSSSQYASNTPKARRSRPGAFEIQIAGRDNKGQLQVELLHSKLNTGKWPNRNKLVRKVVDFAYEKELPGTSFHDIYVSFRRRDCFHEAEIFKKEIEKSLRVGVYLGEVHDSQARRLEIMCRAKLAVIFLSSSFGRGEMAIEEITALTNCNKRVVVIDLCGDNHVLSDFDIHSQVNWDTGREGQQISPGVMAVVATALGIEGYEGDTPAETLVENFEDVTKTMKSPVMGSKEPEKNSLINSVDTQKEIQVAVNNKRYVVEEEIGDEEADNRKMEKQNVGREVGSVHSVEGGESIANDREGLREKEDDDINDKGEEKEVQEDPRPKIGNCEEETKLDKYLSRKDDDKAEVEVEAVDCRNPIGAANSEIELNDNEVGKIAEVEAAAFSTSDTQSQQEVVEQEILHFESSEACDN